VTYFGVEDPSMATAEMQHASDSKHCRGCGAAYEYEAIYLGHLGVYSCPSCGRSRPQPAVAAHQIELNGTRSARFTLHTPVGITTVELPLPGLYNVYNALGAATLCLALGTPLDVIAAGLGSVSAAFGRAERVAIGDDELSILLIKNPAGAPWRWSPVSWTCWPSSTTARLTGGISRGCGMPTSSCWPAGRAA
jgi:UDP-N-acetylmuramyl tripeptide synthase